MKKIAFTILFALIGIMSVNAQEADSLQLKEMTARIDSLTIRLNTLQHDYDFLYVTYELDMLELKLIRIADEANIRSNSISIYYFQKIYNTDYYIAVKTNYNSSVSLFNELKENATYIQARLSNMTSSTTLSDVEISLLKQKSDILNKAINSTESALNVYISSLDLYKSAI